MPETHIVTRMLITGASSGLGKALAVLASARGYQVIACGRNADRMADMAKFDNVEVVIFDHTDEQQTRQKLTGIAPDIAVLNAGTCEYVDVDTFEPDMFRRVIDANVMGPVNCVAALLPELQTGAKLVFVDSLARLLPFARTEAYGASKAALHYLAKSLEVDLKAKGISVQTHSPGFVSTPLTDKNDFDMPMIISAEQAAQAMLNGIENNSASIYFPTLFSSILRGLGALPASWQARLCIKLRKDNNKKRLTQ